MNLILGILPLLIFVLVDTFASMKAALICAIIFAFLEAGYSIYAFGELDSITLITFITILVFAVVSLLKKKSIYFKMAPAILSAFFGIVMLATYFLNDPFLVSFIIKYASLLPKEHQWMASSPEYLALLANATFWIGLSLIFHGIATAIAAKKLGNWAWLLMRGIGFYLFFIIGYIISHKISAP